MNTFLKDMNFSRIYEIEICEKIGGDMNDCCGNDGGVDIVKGDMFIDVKCYRRPIVIDSFKGFFIETYLPLSGNGGWICDCTKKTTHYFLIRDCDGYGGYKEMFFISREDLKMLLGKSIADGSAEFKKIRSAHGYVLPYGYLRGYEYEKKENK